MEEAAQRRPDRTRERTPESGTVTTATPFTVIIPAHDEAAVIGRCLDCLFAGAPVAPGMQVIVVANGCGDATAEFARGHLPKVRVIELERGSKTGAINAGIAAANHGALVVLDADVLCSYACARALIEAVTEPGIMVAAPAIRLDTATASAAVRAYYRVWERQPYARAAKGGAGCYALSPEASARIGEFPDVIADDIWLHTRFDDAERKLVTHDSDGNPVFTTVFPPRTLTGQVRVEARRQIGTAQVAREHSARESATAGGISTALNGGAKLQDVAVFAAIKLAGRLLARWRILRGRGGEWTRDGTTRRA